MMGESIGVGMADEGSAGPLYFEMPARQGHGLGITIDRRRHMVDALAPLTRLFNPASVAVVGASASPDKPGYQMVIPSL